MKTKFYYLVMCLCMTLGTMSFTSCSSDSDEGTTSGGLKGTWINERYLSGSLTQSDFLGWKWESDELQPNVGNFTKGYRIVDDNTVYVFWVAALVGKDADKRTDPALKKFVKTVKNKTQIESFGTYSSDIYIWFMGESLYTYEKTGNKLYVSDGTILTVLSNGQLGVDGNSFTLSKVY